MFQWVLIIFFFVAMGLMSASNEMDRKDYKSGKQKKTYGSSGPYRWKEPGDNEKTMGGVLIFIFVIIIILAGILGGL